MQLPEIYMHRCISLAQKALGSVSPNPLVGAVLVHKGIVIGEGYHQQYGGKHAEVNCIESVPQQYKHLIEDSEMYVSLEPCAHYGKTPPCTHLILQHKIKKLYIGSADPFPLVNGKGAEMLRANGIEVIEGVLEPLAKELNKRFFCYHLQQRPYVILKWAQTADRKMAAEKGAGRLKITGAAVDVLVHQWRAEEDAIMVGKNTAALDNPLLTNRNPAGKNPVRVVTDLQLQLPESLQLFNNMAATVVLNEVKEYEAGNLLYKKIEGSSIPELLKPLWNMKINSLIVEGGAALLQSFINSGIWDEARVITNNKLFAANGLPAPETPQGNITEVLTIGNETIKTIRNIQA